MSLILNALKRLESKAPVASVKKEFSDEFEREHSLDSAVAATASETSYVAAPDDEPLAQFTVGAPSSDDWVDREQTYVTRLDLLSAAINEELGTETIGAETGTGPSVGGHDHPPVDLEDESVEPGLAPISAAVSKCDEPEDIDGDTDEFDDLVVEIGEPVVDLGEALDNTELPTANVTNHPEADQTSEIALLPVGGYETPTDNYVADLNFGFVADESLDTSVDDMPAPFVAVSAEAHEQDVPSEAILQIADFRPPDTKSEARQFRDDHEALAAQWTELDFRGLRDNMLSQLPAEGSATILLAAPDDHSHLAHTVAGLADSLTRLERGEVAIIQASAAKLISVSSGHELHTFTLEPTQDVGMLVADLKQRFRWVLLAADTAVAHRWSGLCDAAYIVVALRSTDRPSALQTIKALNLNGGRVLGCVITGIPQAV